MKSSINIDKQMNSNSIKRKSPWSWIPTLYFAEGLPYFMVMSVAVLMYSRLGLSDTDAALYTSWLYLPWVIKPFWSPIVDLFKTKRWWIVVMQLLIGVGMAGVAFTIPGPDFVRWTMSFFWLMAFSSATHDIAADGFYMLELDSHDQSLFVGIRSTFYRVATIVGQGGLITLAGYLESRLKMPKDAWVYVFIGTSVLFLCLFLYHALFLPKPKRDAERRVEPKLLLHDFGMSFVSFFKKPQILIALLFMLLFRLPEALLVKIAPLFLIKPISEGGLGLSTIDVGIVQGTVGVIGLTLGGIIGGIIVSKGGLKKWLWPMVMSISLPNIVYVFMAYYQPEYAALSGKIIINSCVFLEQFGYGFGFTSYMLYLIYFSQGELQTSHYAFCTGFMALGMMLPGLIAGLLAESVGYLNFFIIVICLVPVTFLVSKLIKVDANFGKKSES